MSRDESRRSKRCRADRDFEMGPGAGILMNDYDDERTLDEEEALEGSEDTHNELSHLQKESDMPLQDLLVMYGYSDVSCQDPNKAEEDDDDEEDAEDEDDDDDDEDDDDPASYESDLKQFYTEMVKAEENGANLKRASAAKNNDTVKSGEAATLAPSVNAHATLDNTDTKTEGDCSGVGVSSSGTSTDNQNPGGVADVGSGAESANISGAAPGSNASGGGGGGSSRLLRSVSRPQSEEEEDDCDYSPDEEEWKKTIMVGSDYQAAIPEGLCRYDDALPYENEDKMLWDPSHISEEQQVEEFLERAQLPVVKGTSLPSGSHVRDDEQALYLLLQCGYNSEEALGRRRMNVLPPTESVSLWSEEECHNFETGLRNYGKDFHLIQKNKVRTRSVGELVQFYYLWKKTERHDIFTYKARLEKKKYALHPGITDYMDRFLEEQEGVRDRSSSPNVNYLLYGDAKRQRTNANSTSNEEPSSGGGKSGLDNWDMSGANSSSSTVNKAAVENWDVSANSSGPATTTTDTSTTTSGVGVTEGSASVNSGSVEPLSHDHHLNSSSSSSVATAASQLDYAKVNSGQGVEASTAAAPSWPQSSSSTNTSTAITSISSSSSSPPSTAAPQQQQQQQQQRNHLYHIQQTPAQAPNNQQHLANSSNGSDPAAMTRARSPENILPHLPP